MVSSGRADELWEGHEDEKGNAGFPEAWVLGNETTLRKVPFPVSKFPDPASAKSRTPRVPAWTRRPHAQCRQCDCRSQGAGGNGGHRCSHSSDYNLLFNIRLSSCTESCPHQYQRTIYYRTWLFFSLLKIAPNKHNGKGSDHIKSFFSPTQTLR